MSSEPSKDLEQFLDDEYKQLKEANRQQAEQIAEITSELAGAIKVNNLKDAENQRLKELQDDTQDHCIDTLQDMLLIKEQENKNLIDERNHLAEGLVQANLDIIRLEKRNDTMHEDYDLLMEVITEQDAEITKLKDEMAESDGCISDTLTLLADYDGYTTERGLRTLVDRAEELLQTHKPMVFKTEKEWESIEKLKSNQSKFSG